jgi:hypothetical protein
VRTDSEGGIADAVGCGYHQSNLSLLVHVVCVNFCRRLA